MLVVLMEVDSSVVVLSEVGPMEVVQLVVVDPSGVVPLVVVPWVVDS